MPDKPWTRPIVPKREAIEGVCVECGCFVPAASVARVLRKNAADGNARVVCVDCSALKHAAKKPAPITIQGVKGRAEGNDDARR
jgi:hypothetical protein